MSDTTEKTEQEQATVEGTYLLKYGTGTVLDLNEHRDELVEKLKTAHPDAALDEEGITFRVVSDNIGREAKVKVTAPVATPAAPAKPKK